MRFWRKHSPFERDARRRLKYHQQLPAVFPDNREGGAATLFHRSIYLWC